MDVKYQFKVTAKSCDLRDVPCLEAEPEDGWEPVSLLVKTDVYFGARDVDNNYYIVWRRTLKED